MAAAEAPDAPAPKLDPGLTVKERVRKRHERLMSDMRETWTPHWKDILSFITPRRGMFEGEMPNRGDKKNSKIVDSSAGQALRILVAGFVSGLTSPNWPWFRLGVEGLEDIPKFGPVGQWLTDVERRMYAVFQKSNLYRVLPTMYEEIGACGTAFSILDADDDTIIRLTQYTLGTFALGQSSKGDVDTIARATWMTIGQIVSEYGYDSMSLKSKGEWDRGEVDKWIEVFQLIEPHDSRIRLPVNAPNMKWRSIHWEKDSSESDGFLRIRGYIEFPGLIPRWETKAESVYATNCPGMMAIPDVRQLQLAVRRKSEAVEKWLRPPMGAPSSMRGMGLDISPAANNWIDEADVARQPAPILTIDPRSLTGIREDIAELRGTINRAFFADLFVTLIASRNQSPQRTATEIAAIESEKLLMLGPVIERIFNDLLTPLVERTYSIMERFGRIPQPPGELLNREIKVTFISTLAQAQRAVGTASIERGTAYVGSLSELWPEARDILDIDKNVDQYLELLNFPPEGVNPQGVRDEIRAARVQREQAMQTAELAKTASEAAQNLGNTSVEDSSVLTRLLAGTGSVAG